MTHESSNEYVKAETYNGVAAIEFFHPQGNALPTKILEALAREIHAAGTDHAAKVIVLRSGGNRAFCAGAHLHELMAIENEKQGKLFFTGFANVINAMRKCPKLIICRVQGNCVGGGVGLAASADYCFAVEHARVRLSELAIGIGPFVVGPAIERKIGTPGFTQLAIDAATWRNAGWANQTGLFTEVHPAIEGMDESLSRLAEVLAHSNPAAMLEMKKMFWQGTEHWDELLVERAAISGRLVLGDFARTALDKIRVKKT